MTNTPVIDPEALENLRALSPDDGDAFLREIVEIFLEDTPKHIVELHAYRTAGDEVAFIRAAHSIKGSASNLGATELRLVAEQLEHETRQSGFPQNVSALIITLEATYARTSEALKKIVS